MKNKLNFLAILIGVFVFLVIFVIFIKLDFLTYRIYTRIQDFGAYSEVYHDYFIGLLFFLFVTMFFLLLQDKRYLKLWLIKTFVTLVIMIPYEYNYGLDSYSYFARALNPQNTVFGESGTSNVMYINHIFTYFVGNSYYSLKLLSSLIGFVGVMFFYKTYEYFIIKNKLELKHDYFIYVIFLFPSILFWSSTLGKDPLNLFFIGLFSYGFIHLIDNFNFRYLIIIAIAVLLVSYIRPWWSIIMITSMFLYYLKVNSIRNFFLFIIILPIFYLTAVEFLKMHDISSFSQIFLKMTSVAQGLAYGGSSVATNTITNISDYMFYYIPNLFTTLFRPMPWDIRNPFTALAAVENVILFYLTYKYIFKNWKIIYNNKYLKFYILLIFSWSLFYVIISPTNLGVAARFKLQVLPAMLILIGAAMAMRKKKERS